MNSEPDWRPAVTRWLRAMEHAVLLKTEDPIGTLERGGDLDIFVKDPAAARKAMVEELGEPLFRARYGNFYEWGHIDLIPRIAWRGAELLDFEETYTKSKVSAEGFRVAGAAANAVLFWLRPILWGGFFKPGCEPLIERALAEDAEEFRHLLAARLGKAPGESLYRMAEQGHLSAAAAHKTGIRAALWRGQFAHHPMRTLITLAWHFETEIALRVRPPLPWIAILGPDGSGKTSVLAAVNELLSAAIPQRKILHWRPRVFRPGDPNAGPVTDPHGEVPRGLVQSLAKLVFFWLDWWVGYWTRLAPDAARLTMSLFDRCYFDLLVDPQRYRYGGPMGLARLMGEFVPQPALLVLLDAPADVLQSRKQEVPLEETRRQIAAYRQLVTAARNGRVVNCDRPVEEVAAEVRELIFIALRNHW